MTPLKSATTGDFALLGTSPCIDSGIDYFEYAAEVWVSEVSGQFMGLAPDMGAVESVGGLLGADSPLYRFWVGNNYPNSFNPTTRIVYSLPTSGRVSLKIFDVAGRLVRHLVSGETRAEGYHTEVWNGRNDRGSTVSSGMYFYCVESENQSLVRKMMLLK